MMTIETMSTTDTTQKTEINAEVFDYFLEVLPPVFLNEKFTFKDGMTVRASFGFAEGYEPITVFWMEGDKFYCRRSSMMNKGA